MKTEHIGTRKIKRKFLSLLLTAAMIFSMLFTLPPITVYAVNPAYANVGTYAEFTTAVADPVVETINVTNGFSLEDDVTIGRSVTVTSNSACTINVGTHSIIIADSGDVSLGGSLSLTGTSTTLQVSSGGTLRLLASYTGTVSANGNNSRGIFVQSQGAAYINGGSVSASGENAYGILLGTGDNMANLYIDMSNTPSIDEVYFDSAIPSPTSFLTSFPTPFSAVMGETATVTLTGVGDGADFQVHTFGVAPPPGTSVELNAAPVPPDDSNTFAVTPNAVGGYKLVLFGGTARSNIYITIPVTVTSGFAGGNGTAESPFQIANIEQLNLVRKFLGSEHTNKYFMLTENINLDVEPYNSGEGWEPIGDNIIGTNNLFQGYFDGNGKTISGLFINRTDDSVGLFGACSDANIQNLGLSGVNITSNNDAGSLAGYLGESSAVANCYATGTVTSEDCFAGGLAGTVSNSTITNSYATCSVTGSTAGGLVGGMGGASSITGSYAAGLVTGTYAGGLVGYKLEGSSVTASYYNSQTSGQSDSDGRGEPKTSSQLVQEATFIGWNFTQGTGNWDISEGTSYPYLQALVPASLPTPPAPTGIMVDPENLTLTYGGTAETLTPSLVGPDGALVPDITWSSSNTGVVTVSNGEVTPIGAGDATITASITGGTISDTCAVKVNKRTLTIGGSFTSGNKQYDGTTTASIVTNLLTLNGTIGSDTVNLNASAVFEDANVGTGKTVTLTGSTLTGDDAVNYVLDFTGAPVTTADITRATGLQAPAAPTLQSKTSTSVTLTPNAEQEFSKDNGTTWQTSNVFTGLKPSTEYSFIARFKDDENHEASPASTALSVTTASSSTGNGDSSSGGSSTSGGGERTSSADNLEIPSSFVSDPNSGKTLTLGNDFASVTISSDMLENVPGIAGKNAEISIGQGDKSGLPNDVKAAIGDRPLISLSLLIDGKQTEWSNPAAPVTVSIPYTPTAAELANPESIVIWYIDGSGKAVSVPNGRYDAATGTVIFSTTHFSDYAVLFNPVSFNDVKSGVWYYKAVSFIAARDITRGTGGGNFSPGSKLTRGDFLVMLMKAYGIAPDTSPDDNFSDAGNTYYTGYLAAAKRLGISAGVGNNMYAPGKEITRQEMFTLLYNALKVIGKLPGTHGRATASGSDQPISEADDQPKGNSGKTLSDFTDADDIAPWAKEAMMLFVKTNTIGGSGGKLNPTITTTRAEMAQVLYNLLSK